MRMSQGLNLRPPSPRQSLRVEYGVINDLPTRMAGVPELVSIPFLRIRLLALDLPTIIPGRIALFIGPLALTNTCISLLTGSTPKDTTRTALLLPGTHLLAPLHRGISSASLTRMEKPSHRVDGDCHCLLFRD